MSFSVKDARCFGDRANLRTNEIDLQFKVIVCEDSAYRIVEEKASRRGIRNDSPAKFNKIRLHTGKSLTKCIAV